MHDRGLEMGSVIVMRTAACRVAFRGAIMLWTNIALVVASPFLRNGTALRPLEVPGSVAREWDCEEKGE